MPFSLNLSTRCCLALLIGCGLLLAACHDTQRNNPLDPELTPEVELTVALNDTAGTARLTWTPYTSDTPFAEYWLLRNIVDRTTVDTLARLADPSQLSFVDSTLQANTAYQYRVSAVNTSGYEAASLATNTPGYTVSAVFLFPVESDPEQGILKLRWSRFRGPGFQSYQIRRQLADTNRDTLLAESSSVTDTIFVDADALADVSYIYTVVVQTADGVLNGNNQGNHLTFPPVQIESLTFRSLTATADLQWTPYTGPRFRAYRILRRTAELATQTIAEITDPTQTTFTDSRLNGNTEYFYQLVIDTDRDEQVPSTEASGLFHPLLDTWPLDVEAGDYVRLYLEPDGRIAALVAGPENARLLFYDTTGRLVAEPLRMDYLSLGNVIAPTSVSMTVDTEGRRFISAASEDLAMILELAADGQLIAQRRAVFTDVLSELFSQRDITLDREMAYYTSGEGFIDQIRLFAEDRLLFVEDYDPFKAENWSYVFRSPRTTDTLVNQSNYSLLNGRLFYNNRDNSTPSVPIAGKTDASWQDFSIEGDFALVEGSASIAIGNVRRSSQFRLILDMAKQQVAMRWWGNAVGPEQVAIDTTFIEPFPFTGPFPIGKGVTYRLGLSLDNQQISAWIESPPLLWSATREGPPGFSSLSQGRSTSRLALSVNNQPYTILKTNRLFFTLAEAIEAPVSEIRTWTLPGTNSSQRALCLPQVNKVRFLSSSSFGPWPTNSVGTLLGTGTGNENGEFIFPLSLAVIPGERFFVLDAGNARIQVFDAEGNYITQWGHQGSTPDAFDFGSGRVPEDFAGSVIADAEGFIYVADVFNRRIQKFAP